MQAKALALQCAHGAALCTQDLERAYELLGCCCITLKPVSTVSPGEGVLRCARWLQLMLCSAVHAAHAMHAVQSSAVQCTPQYCCLFAAMPMHRCTSKQELCFYDFPLVGVQAGMQLSFADAAMCVQLPLLHSTARGC